MGHSSKQPSIPADRSTTADVDIPTEKKDIARKVKNAQRIRKHPVKRFMKSLKDQTDEDGSPIKLHVLLATKVKSGYTWLKKKKPNLMKQAVIMIIFLVTAALCCCILWVKSPANNVINEGDIRGSQHQPMNIDNQDLRQSVLRYEFPVVRNGNLGDISSYDDTFTLGAEVQVPRCMETQDHTITGPEYVEENPECVTKPDGVGIDGTNEESVEIGAGSEDQYTCSLGDRLVLANNSTSDMEREDGSDLFKAVQVSEESEEGGGQDLRKCGDVLEVVRSLLKRDDVSNQYDCEELLNSVMGPVCLIGDKEPPIFTGFHQDPTTAVCLTVNLNKDQVRKLDLDPQCLPLSISKGLLAEIKSMMRFYRIDDEEKVCPVAQEKEERSNVCLLGEEHLPDYMNATYKGSFLKLPNFNRSFHFVQKASTHQSHFGEQSSYEALLVCLEKLKFLYTNGVDPVVTECDVGHHQNLSVKPLATPVTIPSEGQETTKKQAQQCNSQKKVPKYRAEPTQCGVGGAVGGSGGGAGDDDGEDDGRRRKKLPDDKLDFLQAKNFNKKSKRLQERLEEARQILIAFGCNYCHYSPADNNRLCILLGASVCADEVVVCSQTECPAKDFTHEDVRFLYVYVQEPLLHLFSLYMQDLTDDDLEALENAIKDVKKVFECAICFDTPIYSDVTLVMCEDAHPICLPCREKLITSQCPFCRKILPERLTTRWPRCLYEALNGRSMPDPSPSTVDDGMKQVRPPPEMTYIPPFEYTFGDSNEPEAQIYGDSAPRTVHPQRLYSALDVDTLGEIHDAQDLLAEDTPPPSAHPDDDVIGAIEGDQIVPNAPEEWMYQRFANYQQNPDGPLDDVDDQVVADDRTFQRQLENYQQTHNAQRVADERNAVQRRYERFLRNVVYLGTNYLSHEEFAEVTVSQNTNQAAGASASVHQDNQEEEDTDLRDAADRVGLGAVANEAAGGMQTTVVHNKNDAVAQANQNVANKRGRKDDDDSGRDTNAQPSRTNTPRQHLQN